MRYLALVAAGVTLSIATPAFADDWEFILINDTGKTIKTIDISPAGTATWQPNKIDPDIVRETSIAAGKRGTIHFTKDAKQCSFDIRATYADASNAVWSGINVCDNAYVTVRYGKDGAPAFATS